MHPPRTLLLAALPLARGAKIAVEPAELAARAAVASTSDPDNHERSWSWPWGDGNGDDGDGDGDGGWPWGDGDDDGDGDGGGWGWGGGDGGGWGGGGGNDGDGWGCEYGDWPWCSATTTSTSAGPGPTGGGDGQAGGGSGSGSGGAASLPGYTLNVDLADIAPIAVRGNWKLAVRGQTGVSAQQLTIVDDYTALIYDKIEANLLVYPHQNNQSIPAWGAVYDLRTNKPRALSMKTNSFCAGGAWLGNGTYASVGGTPSQYLNLANNANGLQSVRMFTPCDGGTSCDVYDDPMRQSLAVPRWYPSTVKMADGGLMIIGGSDVNTYINNASVNVPNLEYWPPRFVAGYWPGQTLPLDWLKQTLNANLFPIAIPLPTSQVFMCARTSCILYNPDTNQYSALPGIPNGVKISYPMSGSAQLLPLRPAANYTPEVLICGGSTVADVSKPGQHNISVNDPASNQCARMVVSTHGIKAGWKVEHMSQARHMHSIVNLPNGRAIIVNGAQTGVSSYGGALGSKAVGKSNANNPALQGDVYDPWRAAGARFHQTGVPKSDVPRMYHSTAVLSPSGEIMIAGSAPHNLAAPVKSPTNPFPTTYTVEFLTPPHIAKAKGWAVASLSKQVDYAKTFTIALAQALPVGSFSVAGTKKTTSKHTLAVTLIDPGYSTHGQQLNARTVQLVVQSVSSDRKTLTVSSPPTHYIFAPGYGWVYVLVDGVWGAGKRIMIGPGTVGTLPLRNNATQTTRKGPAFIGRPESSMRHGDPLRVAANAAKGVVKDVVGAAGDLLDEVVGNVTQH